MELDLGTTVGILAGISGLLFLKLYRKKVSPLPLTINGFKALKNPVFIYVIGWIYIVVASTLLGIFQKFNITHEILKIGILVVLFSLGLYSVLLFKRVSLLYKREELKFTPFLGKPINFNWSDIIDVKWSGLTKQWTIYLSNGKRFRVNPYMNGISDFLNELGTRTTPELSLKINEFQRRDKP